MSIIKNYLKQNKVTHTFTSCQWPIGDPQEKDFIFVKKPMLLANHTVNLIVMLHILMREN